MRVGCEASLGVATTVIADDWLPISTVCDCGADDVCCAPPPHAASVNAIMQTPAIVHTRFVFPEFLPKPMKTEMLNSISNVLHANDALCTARRQHSRSAPPLET